MRLIFEDVTLEDAVDQTARDSASAANNLAQKAITMFGELKGIRVVTQAQYNAIPNKTNNGILYVVV